MKLDIKKIMNQCGCTVEEFAMEIGISIEELMLYSEGKMQMTLPLLLKISQYTSIPADQLFVVENSTSFEFNSINPDDTFEPYQQTKNNLVEYIKQGLNEFQYQEMKQEIVKIDNCLKTLKKPRISFAGQSDTGKSTLINALLGAEKMPAKWTPTTSIVVHIKHIDDKPQFINDDVWVFKAIDGKVWDDNKLADEAYCNKHLLQKGDFSLLSELGTHQSTNDAHKLASSAVAFIDSPLLKDCDILDLPGFAATKEDDALHRFNTQEHETDILIYLSRSNGFLQDRDIDYLRKCILSLRTVEKKDVNNISKLGNLFIVASQAGAVNNGNASELSEILERRCEALCKTYMLAAANNGVKSILPERSKMTGYEYTADDLFKRFFTYEKDSARLCKKFVVDFTKLAEELPNTLYCEFCNNLKETIALSDSTIRQRIDEWIELLNNKAKYLKLVKEIKAKEPARKTEASKKLNQLKTDINNLNEESNQDIQTMYTETIKTEALVALIEKEGIRNKKSDKQDFVSSVNELLESKTRHILMEKTDEYSKKLDNYLSEYSKTLEYNADDEKDINVKFNVANSFAMGLAGLGVLGASATWLATSFTALSVSVLGTMAGLGSIFAVGGVIGIGIGAILTVILAVVKAFNWKKDLAKQIVKAYNEQNYIEKIIKNVDQYWKDTIKGVDAASKNVEKDWEDHISEYESIADEKNIPVLESKIAEAKKGLDFFIKMPMPEIG